MREVRERRPISENTRRAQQLLVAGLVGGHMAGLTVVGLFLALGGTNAGATAAIGAAVVLAFYTIALGVQLRLFAPFLPFVTEEVWRWTNETSIHRSPWPTVEELSTDGDAALLADVAEALIAIRGAKSNAKVSMRAEVSRAVFHGPAASLERLRAIEPDLRAVGRLVGDVEWAEGAESLSVDVELAESPA